MSSRLHNKFHRHNHHTLSSLDPRFPDSSHDPIASPNSPFQGDFVLHGSLSASTYQTSAYAATFSGNVGVNTATPNVELTVYGNVSSSDNTTTTTLSVLDSAYITNSLTVNNISPQISSPLKVNGDVTITGNLSTLGSLTYLDTVVQVMSSMTINNAGVGPALTVTQTGNQPIMVSYDDNNGIALWVDGHNASPACVGIGVSASPQAKLVVAGNIVAGTNNNTTSLSSSIFGGSNNNISSPNSFVLGGSANNTGFNNTFIIGSNLSASQDNFTYVNNLSSQGTINTNGLSAQSVTVNGVISSNNVFYSSGGNSANWNTAYTYATAYNLSASNYNNTYSTVQSNSANYNNTTTTVNSNSANWNTAYAYSTAYNLSASNYNNTYSTVQSNSANYNNTTTTVNSNSANWNTAYIQSNTNSISSALDFCRTYTLIPRYNPTSSYSDYILSADGGANVVQNNGYLGFATTLSAARAYAFFSMPIMAQYNVSWGSVLTQYPFYTEFNIHNYINPYMGINKVIRLYIGKSSAYWGDLTENGMGFEMRYNSTSAYSIYGIVKTGSTVLSGLVTTTNIPPNDLNQTKRIGIHCHGDGNYDFYYNGVNALQLTGFSNVFMSNTVYLENAMNNSLSGGGWASLHKIMFKDLH